MDANFVRVLGTLGMNGLFWGLKKVVPRIPAAIVPPLNLGIMMALSIYAPWLLTPTDALVVAGGSTLIHQTVKNLKRGDKLGQDSVPIPIGVKPEEVKVVEKWVDVPPAAELKP